MFPPQQGPPDAGSGGNVAKKAADQVTQGLATLYKECHKAGDQDLCDTLMMMMQDVSKIEQTIESGGTQANNPMPADVENAADAAMPGDAAEDAADHSGALPDHGPHNGPAAAQDAHADQGHPFPANHASIAGAQHDQGSPFPHRGAKSIADAAGMLHNATMAEAAKKKLKQG